jgi:hypothetical protein
LHHGRRRRAGVRHLWRALAITDTNFESNRVAIRDALVTAIRAALYSNAASFGSATLALADAIITAANGEAIAVTERVADSLAVPKPDAEPESIALPHIDAIVKPIYDAIANAYTDGFNDAERERGDGGRDREVQRNGNDCEYCGSVHQDQFGCGLHYFGCGRGNPKRDADDGRRDDKPTRKLADLFQLHYDTYVGDGDLSDYPVAGTDDHELLYIFGLLHIAAKRPDGRCYVCDLAHGSKSERLR